MKQEQLADSIITIEETLDDGRVCKLVSGGIVSGVNAEIEIDGTQYCQQERGINIVVYNKKLNELISSVYFDTYLTENPYPAEVRNGIPYIMTDINKWEVYCDGLTT